MGQTESWEVGITPGKPVPSCSSGPTTAFNYY